MDWLLSFPSTFSLLFSSFSYYYLSHGREWRDFMHKSMSDWFCSKWLGRLEMRVLFSISVPLLLNKYIKSACQIPLQPYHIKIEPAHLLKIEGDGDWASVSSQKHQAKYFAFGISISHLIFHPLWKERKRGLWRETACALIWRRASWLKNLPGFSSSFPQFKGKQSPHKTCAS